MSSELRYQALMLHEDDHVATAIVDLEEGSDVTVERADGSRQRSTVTEAIPFGHKFALDDIPAAVEILKYGEKIGITNAAIPAGRHVHVHNVDSQRGRGDLATPHGGDA